MKNSFFALLFISRELLLLHIFWKSNDTFPKQKKDMLPEENIFQRNQILAQTQYRWPASTFNDPDFQILDITTQ